jgi:hypothetical protein
MKDPDICCESALLLCTRRLRSETLESTLCNLPPSAGSAAILADRAQGAD